MKTFIKIITAFTILMLFFSCQSEKEIYGKWEIADIIVKDTADAEASLISIAGLGLCMVQSDFNYLEFTHENELKSIDNNNNVIGKEKFSFSDDETKLIARIFNLDEEQVFLIEFQNKIKLTLENKDVILKLEKIKCK